MKKDSPDIIVIQELSSVISPAALALSYTLQWRCSSSMDTALREPNRETLLLGRLLMEVWKSGGEGCERKELCDEHVWGKERLMKGGEHAR